ncbi:MAG: hypothetical protein CMP10_13825 [Zetaproteobacteria bacterium]|nr:hypothetical protein [Pseudobdellovibrionaceae bacterium]
MAKVKQAVVTEVKLFQEHSVAITLKMNQPEKLVFKAGQYIIVDTKINKGNGKTVKKAWSLASSNEDGSLLTLGVRRIGSGQGSNWAYQLTAGEEIQFGGPYGKLTADEAPALIVATDTGITAAIGLLLGTEIKPYLKGSRLLWLRSVRQEFLSDEYVREQIPDDLGNLVISDASAPDVPDRISSMHRQVESFVGEKKFLGSVYLVGDGDVVGPLERYFVGTGVLEERVKQEFFFRKPAKIESRTKGMRTGYTTGACAAAAAKAAAQMLVTGQQPTDVKSVLPNGQEVVFDLKRCDLLNGEAVCSIIKDGGDDPDCTHGAEITAQVKLIPEEGIHIYGGEGVAVVTRPGLGLELGSAAINPVPRQNITEMVMLELADQSAYGGAEVTISVPDGVERAKQTLNERLGLINGISILGTTGLVQPYSTAAFVSSVASAIDIAAHNRQESVVFTTGGRSEQFAMKLLPDLQEMAFIQVGDYIGIGIRNSVRRDIKKIYIVGMMGKLSKMADNKMMTHASRSEVNMKFLSELARDCGADPAIQDEISQANTGRHVLEIAQKKGISSLPDLICEKVVMCCGAFARTAVEFDVTMVDFGGTIIGKHPPIRQRTN